ncbi:mitochondrial distribution and morphology protein-domain-containing protein [Crepidotus variabilis]|uniref:Mitochondrial distribution and morphology protein-domain-containing protein n=1 Tax=Crepidotus variabilis TaxID=179855 RepID=A0A9P6JNG0_9AGAR|nr:mitochondrial distribution and morphology protein-domain-containing protein [Crepidotus variabilis]
MLACQALGAFRSSVRCLGPPRTTHSAVFDRYGAIRNFFRQQHSTTKLSAGRISKGLVQTDENSRTTGHHFRAHQCSSGASISTYRRVFSTDKPGPEKAPPNDSKAPKPPEDARSKLPETSDSPFNELKFPHARDHENYSRFFLRLAQSVPHLHRPTRDDFLNVATGFWQRLRIRFKWFTVRSFRKFNADDISAFVSWFLVSQTLWILIGTTTFFSVIFATINSLRLQNTVARAISDYLTAETGVTIIFESAIVPKWKDSRLSIKNVYVSRRPTNSKLAAQQMTSSAHMAAVGYDVSNHPAYHHVGEEDEEIQDSSLQDEDTNYTMFDLNIDSVDVTLSLKRWLDGKGLIEDAVVRGVRGVIDRRNVFWDPDHPLDPASFRHASQTGDFELESLELEDVLITVYQPGDFRPYTASIFRADIRTFRKAWMFYDFLCAENVVGQFDNCLFSLHRPQSIGRTNEKDMKDNEWVRMSRIRIDGVNVDHLQDSTTTEGPISWITSGKVDAVLDIKFPRDPKDDLPFNAILGEIADAISTSLSIPDTARIPGQRELAKPPLSAPEQEEPLEEKSTGDYKPRVIIDIDLRFRDLKAAVPIFTSDLSYINNALIRPIVAFMNSNRTLIPIHCRVVKDLSEFDGSWTMWETGLMDEIAAKTYDALAYHVSQSGINRQRMKTVSLWSLQRTAGAVMSALKMMTDPMSAHLKDVYVNAPPR